MAATEPVQEPAAEACEGSKLQKPKKAVSAYWIFSSKVREEVTKEIKEKNGGKAGLGDIAKATTARWGALSEAEKKEFEDKAAQDKQRYADEFKVFQEASDPAGVLRTKYAHLIPKRPMTPYFAFSQDPKQREKAAAALKEAGTEAGMKQITAKLGEMWKAMSAQEKAPLEEKHKQEQAEFLQKQKDWQATPEFAEIEAAVKKQAEQQKAEQQKEEGQEVTTPQKGTKRSRSSAKTAAPKDDAKSGETPGSAGAAKKGRKSAPAKEDQVAIDADVVAEASKAGLEGMLRNLASRPEVVAAGKSSRDIYKALQASNGLVNPAKRALLGA